MNFNLEEEKDIDSFMEKNSLMMIPVPEEMEQRINSWVTKKNNKKKKNRKVLYTFSTAAATILLAGSLLLSPNVMTYANDNSFVRFSSNWLSQFAEFAGIRSAQENGYKPVMAYQFAMAGYQLTIDHLYLEDNQIFFLLSAKGAQIEEKVIKVNSNYEFKDDQNIAIKVESEDFKRPEDRNSGGLSSMGLYQDKDGSIYIQQVNRIFLERDAVIQFLDSNKTSLAFRVTIGDESKEINIPISKENIQLGTEYKQDYELGFIKQENKIKKSLIESLKVYPTRMNLELNLEALDGEIELDYLKGKEPYLKDDKGNVYPLAPIAESSADRKSLEFTSSIHFSKDIRRLTLHASDSFNFTEDKISKKIFLDLAGSFPQTIQFNGKSLTILNAKWKDGYLLLEIKRENEKENVLKGVMFEVLGDQRISHDESISDPKVKGYYEDKILYGDIGIGVIPKDNSDNKEIYEIRMYAKKTSRYELGIKRWMDPLKLESDIPLSISK